MRSVQGKRMAGLLFLILLFLIPCNAYAGTEKGQSQGTEAYLEELYGLTDFSGADQALEGETALSFTEIVKLLVSGGSFQETGKLLLEEVKAQILGGMEQNRKLLAEVVMLAVLFSVIRNFTGAFEAAYVGNLCFVMVYSVIAVLLLKSFLVFRETVETALTQCIDFMRAFVPTLCISMVFTSDTASSIGFYQLAFVVIYLVESVFCYVFLPVIQVYILLEIFVHLLPEEKFSNLTELFRDVIGWGMKISGAAVIGLNVVQGLIAPAKDRLGQGILGKTAAAVPGIGNTVSSAIELMFGTGMVLKNGIGAAGVCVLFLLGLFPMIKVVVLILFCKVAAAVTEPVTDRRIAGCLKGMAEGGMLYGKLLGYGILLFLLTITLAVASSGLAH